MKMPFMQLEAKEYIENGCNLEFMEDLEPYVIVYPQTRSTDEFQSTRMYLLKGMKIIVVDRNGTRSGIINEIDIDNANIKYGYNNNLNMEVEPFAIGIL